MGKDGAQPFQFQFPQAGDCRSWDYLAMNLTTSEQGSMNRDLPGAQPRTERLTLIVSGYRNLCPFLLCRDFKLKDANFNVAGTAECSSCSIDTSGNRKDTGWRLDFNPFGM